MTNRSETTMSKRSVLRDVISGFFGIVFLAMGLVNTFWGNDPGYGVFIVLLSVVFFPAATAFLKKISGRSVPLILKIILGAFIIWPALGVGELSDKIDLMLMNL